mgnify:CR=1 FL=1
MLGHNENKKLGWGGVASLIFEVDVSLKHVLPVVQIAKCLMMVL